MKWTDGKVHLLNCLFDTYFRWWHNWKCCHYSIRIFFANFRQQQCSHSRTSTTAKWMSQLKTLKTVTAFCFFAYNIQNRFNKFSAFGIVTFCPIIACNMRENRLNFVSIFYHVLRNVRLTGTRLTEYEIIWSEYLSHRWHSNRVHCSWF